MSSRALTIVVGGMISAVPYQGGWTWVILQYLLGLKQLGHDVYFIEVLPQKTIRPSGGTLAESSNAAYFRQVVSEFGFERHAALMVENTRESVGLSYDDAHAAARKASVLLNVSGALVDDSLTQNIPIRVYLDLDPAFTQIWHAQGIDMRFGRSTHFVTVGLALGAPDCKAPSCGIPWIPTLQPIVLNQWPAGNGIAHDALTTVANWRGYGSVEHDGVFYGQKAHSLRQFMKVPCRTREHFTLALSIHPDERKDLEALATNGWRIVDPSRVTATPSLYRDFIQGSKAEFGIAKAGYVASNCGWFSDRSICYLASGRPVIAQETGFSRFLPTGEGLLAFQTEDDVLAAIETLREDYARHSRAARSLAVDYFDSDKVLTALLEKVRAL
jgi:hypothetical protein